MRCGQLWNGLPVAPWRSPGCVQRLAGPGLLKKGGSAGIAQGGGDILIKGPVLIIGLKGIPLVVGPLATINIFLVLNFIIAQVPQDKGARIALRSAHTKTPRDPGTGEMDSAEDPDHRRCADSKREGGAWGLISSNGMCIFSCTVGPF